MDSHWWILDTCVNSESIFIYYVGIDLSNIYNKSLYRCYSIGYYTVIHYKVHAVEEYV